jgi:poly [ADP-ribose] polymerase
LINTLQKYTSQQLSDNYYFSSKNVTQKQLKTAEQYLMDALHHTKITDKNAALLELYKVIPRKMKNVNDYLCHNLSQFNEIFTNERDLLNNLIVENEIVESNVLQSLNISVEIATDDDLDIINKIIKIY